jgi:hypothetical protein
MKKLILFFLLISPFISKAQGSANTSLQGNGTESMLEAGFIPKFNTREIETKGSRFFNSEYAHGEVTMRNGRKYGSELLYKFDALENTVQIKMRNGQEISLPSNEIETFRLHFPTDTLIFFRSEIPNDKGKERLFLILYATKEYKLIKLPAKRFRTVNNKTPYATGEIYDEFKDDSKYFLKLGTGAFTEVSLSKKSLTKAIPSRKAALQKLFDTPEYKDLNDWNVAGLLQKIDILISK